VRIDFESWETPASNDVLPDRGIAGFGVLHLSVGHLLYESGLGGW
jgi:hypothetical protein